MHILLTNDDGIYAPGLAAIKDALSELGTVTVVAPAAEQSGVGLSITYRHPLMAREEYIHGEFFGYAVFGSPADCVKMGVLEFCKEKPDLIVSGINSGANIGINVLYSGTVAGAIEGAFFGITSIAVSQSMLTAPNYDTTSKRAAEVIKQLLEQKPPTGSLWNLNFPHDTPEGPKGLKVVSMGCNRQQELIERRLDPRGKPYYWCGLEPIKGHSKDPGTDIEAIQDGFATLTPLRFDLTETSQLAEYQQKSFEV